ncbi:MAG TPA: hypothetical protein DCE41_15540 [Cytophagales bacterium]|nr:hypothetical protein [Cytophagales bacterium]
MIFKILLAIHITAGALGIGSGMGALLFRKGQKRHNQWGRVFYYAMLTMGSSAFLLGIFFQGSLMNGTIGLFTTYLVISAFGAVKNRTGHAGRRETWEFVLGLVCLLIFGILSVDVLRNGTKTDGLPFPVYYSYTGVALLVSLFDLKLIKNRGIYGAQRIGRHLGRMCIALLIATASYFLGQPNFLPAPIRGTFIPVIPVLLVLLSWIFWLVKNFATRRFKKRKVRAMA